MLPATPAEPLWPVVGESDIAEPHAESNTAATIGTVSHRIFINPPSLSFLVRDPHASNFNWILCARLRPESGRLSLRADLWNLSDASHLSLGEVLPCSLARQPFADAHSVPEDPLQNVSKQCPKCALLVASRTAHSLPRCALRTASHPWGENNGRGGSAGANNMGGSMLASGGGAPRSDSGAGGSAADGGASTSTGGSSGSGGSKGPLGQRCTAGTECSTGVCADGVCCDGSCNQPCEQCGSDGRCVATTDDVACGTIGCPSDTICANYQPSITTNRCLGRGVCKTAANCTFTPAPARTACGADDDSYICDGAGACSLPTVKCGASLCTANFDVTTSVNQQGCCDGTACTSTCSQDRTFCHEGADCAIGRICCHIQPMSWSTASCQVPANCGTFPQVCNPSANECPGGTTCLPIASSSSLPAGYYTCQ